MNGTSKVAIIGLVYLRRFSIMKCWAAGAGGAGNQMGDMPGILGKSASGVAGILSIRLHPSRRNFDVFPAWLELPGVAVVDK